ncbi:MAG: hypothetical protein ACTS4U_00655 [Candidatus Hodgkinia cicadicola]
MKEGVLRWDGGGTLERVTKTRNNDRLRDELKVNATEEAAAGLQRRPQG